MQVIRQACSKNRSPTISSLSYYKGLDDELLDWLHVLMNELKGSISYFWFTRLGFFVLLGCERAWFHASSLMEVREELTLQTRIHRAVTTLRTRYMTFLALAVLLVEPYRTTRLADLKNNQVNCIFNSKKLHTLSGLRNSPSGQLISPSNTSSHFIPRYSGKQKQFPFAQNPW